MPRRRQTTQNDESEEHGETNLSRLLATLDPEMHDDEYVFCTVPDGVVPPGVAPVFSFREDEGLTIVAQRAAVESNGLEFVYPARWITLRVHSALDAVGMTAAVAAELTAHGISCNVVAAYHHHHLFVPADRGEDAVQVLRGLGGKT